MAELVHEIGDIQEIYSHVILTNRLEKTYMDQLTIIEHKLNYIMSTSLKQCQFHVDMIQLIETKLEHLISSINVCQR
jgi:hypothetical protein